MIEKLVARQVETVTLRIKTVAKGFRDFEVSRNVASELTLSIAIAIDTKASIMIEGVLFNSRHIITVQTIERGHNA